MEYPSILKYEKFKGKVIFPKEMDYKLAFRIQVKLQEIGKMKGFSDLFNCSYLHITLVTKDKHFLDIKKVWEEF